VNQIISLNYNLENTVVGMISTQGAWAIVEFRQQRNKIGFSLAACVSTVVKHLLGQPWTVFLVKILMSRLDSLSTVPALCRATAISTHQLAFCDIVCLHD